MLVRSSTRSQSREIEGSANKNDRWEGKAFQVLATLPLLHDGRFGSAR